MQSKKRLISIVNWYRWMERNEGGCEMKRLKCKDDRRRCWESGMGGFGMSTVATTAIWRWAIWQQYRDNRQHLVRNLIEGAYLAKQGQKKCRLHNQLWIPSNPRTIVSYLSFLQMIFRERRAPKNRYCSFCSCFKSAHKTLESDTSKKGWTHILWKSWKIEVFL